MTENKIREFVQSLRYRVETFVRTGWAIDGLINDYTKSADTIEKLFEEIQQYRAIGTVEEIQQKDEVIATQRDIIDGVYKDYEKYLKIGTIEEFKALKEKSVEKKPIRNDLCTCPSCGTHNEVIKKRRNTVAFDTVHCWHCGQAISVVRD